MRGIAFISWSGLFIGTVSFVTGCGTVHEKRTLSKVCEVHDVGMRSSLLPGWGGCALPTLPYAEARLQKFPHSYPHQMNSPWPWKRRRVELCNFCINAEQLWLNAVVRTNATRETPGTNGSRIFVGREVLGPGELGWTEGMTLTDAIFVAGGLTSFANPRRIEIRRNDEILGPYNYDLIIMGKQVDPVVEAGDYVNVITPCW